MAVLLGNGDGTFKAAVNYNPGGTQTTAVVVADVNGDAKPDLIVANYGSGSGGYIGVLLGNGDGTFQPAVTYGSITSYPADYAAGSVAVADVNGDGKPDVVFVADCVAWECNIDSKVVVLLGNGDGTFQSAVTYDSGGNGSELIVAADVNRDGKSDILVANVCNDYACDIEGVIGVLLNNGDGIFQPAVNYPSGGYYSFAVSDMNGDGKSDIVATGSGNTATVLLGNGDGSFQSPVAFGSGGNGAHAVAVADMNGDGKPDILIANSQCIENGCGNQGSVGLLINSSLTPASTTLASSLNPSNFGQAVTFTAAVTAQPGFYKGKPTGTVSFFDTATGTSLGSSSLNSSAVAMVQFSTLGPSTHSIVATYQGDANFTSGTSPVLSQVVLGSGAKFSPTSLVFGNQPVATSSSPQNITLKNTGDIPLTFNSITITGANPVNFSQTNNCGSSLAGGSTCVISVRFKPNATGTRTAAVTFSDSAPSKLQKVSLSGIGVLPTVTLTPTSVTFPKQVVYTSNSSAQIELNNSGPGILNISSIAATGPFTQTNNCGSTVNPGNKCFLTVTFTPDGLGSLSGSILIKDNASTSSQTISLTGIGMAIQLMPIGLSFANQPVGTASLPKTITLSNKSHQMVNISSISVLGADPEDFTIVSSTCLKSVASGASCFIKVKFTPTATGKRRASVAIINDGGGGRQGVGLAGTGT